MSPNSDSSPPRQVEKVMKALHVRRLALWPRFHAYVQEELDVGSPEVCACMGVWGCMLAYGPWGA